MNTPATPESGPPDVAAVPVTGPVMTAPQTRRGRFAGLPLRRKLVAAVIVVMIAITTATGLVTGLALQRSLEASLDEKVVATATRAVRPIHDGLSPATLGDLGPRGLGGDYLLLIANDSVAVTNLVFTHSGQASALNSAQVQALLDSGLGAKPTTIDLGGDLGRYRLVASRKENTTVISGLPTAELERTVAEVRQFTFVLAAGGVVILAGATTIIIRRSLRPLERVAGIATRVSNLPLSTGDGTVAERVPWADTDRRTEVGQVGAAVNDLLDHIDTSLQARAGSERKLRQFVADASHELRTPLASIRGYAELTRREREPVPAGVLYALDRVESEAQRMTRLVEDLLLLARLDAGRETVRVPVDLTHILLDAINDAHAAGPEHVWRLDVPQDAVEVTGDPGQLTQVVVNLLGNARSHTPAGSVVTARLRAAQASTDAAMVTLEVSDNGPGIPESVAQTLFDRFSQGDPSRTGGSTGLGLSIVAAVVSAHGGTVEVAQHEGPGASFVVRLPRGEAHS